MYRKYRGVFQILNYIIRSLLCFGDVVKTQMQESRNAADNNTNALYFVKATNLRKDLQNKDENGRRT